jgi:uncharacterized protein YjbI with pentapeptide repeats
MYGGNNMATQEHLDILKQGVEVWNQWRKEHPEIRPDLSEADWVDTDLSGADLSETKLRGASLRGVDLSFANLSRANLSRTYLSRTNLDRANLNDVDLSQATIGWTHFDALDLRQVRGLETLYHNGPSHISIDTIYRSGGHIPEDFLRKAGVPGSFIDYMHSLIVKPIDYYTCFISYASQDQNFADRLYADLQNKGVRCWFAPEHLKIGDEIRTRIDESIRVYDKLLLVLSAHALESAWVKDEVEAALEKEKQQHSQVLFPIAVDDAVKHTTQAWAATIRRRKHIGDFTRWKQHDDYQEALERLLRDLKAEAQT